MDNLLNNSWVVGVGVTVVGGLILHFFFGIGNEKQSRKINKSPLLSAGGDITAGRDIIIGSNKKIQPVNKSESYVYKNKRFIVAERESKNLIISVPPTKFRKISSKITLINSDNKMWRVGYVFIKNESSKSYYVFHVFQDSGSNSFNSRIVEIESNKEIFPDIPHAELAVDNTKTFILTVENKDDNILFFIDNIPLGKYKIPLGIITDIYIRGWSHNNVEPITMVVEYTRVWF